jgi:hypothetical protein
MKNYVITSGAFTKKGNFTGYTALGQRIHFHERQMKAIGVTTDADLKFPLYSVADIKTINPFDENGKPALDESGNLVATERLTATSVFLSKAELVNAHVDNATIDVDIRKGIMQAGKDAGLSESAVEELASLSI